MQAGAAVIGLGLVPKSRGVPKRGAGGVPPGAVGPPPVLGGGQRGGLGLGRCPGRRTEGPFCSGPCWQGRAPPPASTGQRGDEAGGGGAAALHPPSPAATVGVRGVWGQQMGGGHQACSGHPGMCQGEGGGGTSPMAPWRQGQPHPPVRGGLGAWGCPPHSVPCREGLRQAQGEVRAGMCDSIGPGGRGGRGGARWGTHTRVPPGCVHAVPRGGWHPHGTPVPCRPRTLGLAHERACRCVCLHACAGV